MRPFFNFCLLLIIFSFFFSCFAEKDKVCVYTIAKNEAKHVKRFAESANLADYVLVVDTGSEDNTVDLLKENNINVVEKNFTPWRFDTARNFALESLPEDCEICVWQDMDEVMTPEDWPDKLRGYFSQGNVNNVLVHFVYPNSFDYWRYKAHRRNGFHYKYAVHEIFVPDEGVPNNSAYADDIICLHLVDSSKKRNYIPLLEISIQEFPDEVPSHTFWLARDYYFTEQFGKAIETFIKYLNLKTAKWEPERAAACDFIAESIWRLNYADQIKYCEKAREEDKENGIEKWKGEITGEELIERIEGWFVRGTQEAPNYRDPFLSLSNWYIAQFQYDKAWDTLIQCLFILDKDPIYLVTERAWTFGPYQDLARVLIGNNTLVKVWNSNLNKETIYQILYQVALSYAGLGRWAEAQELFLECWSLTPYHLEPLYQLMSYYYYYPSQPIAYMYGRQGLSTLKPSPNSFWNDMEIYSYKFDDIFSVVAGHIGEYQEGLEAAERASKNAPEKDRERILNNYNLYEKFLQYAGLERKENENDSNFYKPEFDY